GCPGADTNSVCAIHKSSCFSRCLRVPIAMRRFYEQTLWIPQNFPPTNPKFRQGHRARRREHTQRPHRHYSAKLECSPDANCLTSQNGGNTRGLSSCIPPSRPPATVRKLPAPSSLATALV